MTTNLTRNVKLITDEFALLAVTAALQAAKAQGVAITVTVYNALMVMIVLVHSDGATPHSVETAKRKAQTSASTRRPSGWMNEELAIALPMASGNLLTNVGGGFPIKVNGIVVGALGVAGGTVDQDRAIAIAALRAIGADAVE